MKFDGFSGEKTILSFKLANGVSWLTTHRLIIQQEKHNPRLKVLVHYRVMVVFSPCYNSGDDLFFAN
jgi:hypothetical protein